MIMIDVENAQKYLMDILNQATQGEEIIITRHDGSTFKLVPVHMPVPIFGSAAGLIKMNDDFDEPLDEFEDYYR